MTRFTDTQIREALSGARFGKRRVAKMWDEVNAHRRAVASGDPETIQATWDKIEEHIDYAYQMAAKGGAD